MYEHTYKTIHPAWNAAETFRVKDAAALLSDVDPSSGAGLVDVETRMDILMNEITAGKLKATVRTDINGQTIWTETTIDREDLTAWLKRRNETASRFFFPAPPRDRNVPGYLDPAHPRYAPWMAAAHEAWHAIDESQTHRAVIPALEKFLADNATRFGLLNNEGNPSEKAIKQIAAVANWNKKGGAPKTPG